MMPGSKVLYLGAASGTTVSHVSDIVGPVSGIMLAKAHYVLKPGFSNHFLFRALRTAVTLLT